MSHPTPFLPSTLERLHELIGTMDRHDERAATAPNAEEGGAQQDLASSAWQDAGLPLGKMHDLLTPADWARTVAEIELTPAEVAMFLNLHADFATHARETN